MTLREYLENMIKEGSSFSEIAKLFTSGLYGQDNETDSMFNNVFNIQSIEGFETTIKTWYAQNLSREFSPNFVPVKFFEYEKQREDIPELLLELYEVLMHGCYLKYREKWLGIYNALFKEYDMLHPYTITYAEDESNNLDTTNKLNETTADSGKGANKTTNDETTDSVYGFNSTSGVPSDKSQHTEDNEYTDSNTRTRENTITYGSDRNVHREYTRKGNSGNITSQEQIRAEIELRKTQMSQIIFDDLNAYFTLGVY